MYTDKNKIETYLDNDEHSWLMLSHNVKKIMELVTNVENKILKLAIINVVMILSLKNVMKVLIKMKI